MGLAIEIGNWDWLLGLAIDIGIGNKYCQCQSGIRLAMGIGNLDWDVVLELDEHEHEQGECQVECQNQCQDECQGKGSYKNTKQIGILSHFW